jgi:ATP-dependent Clp protease protease subunit
MQYVNPDVATICTGLAASMGAVLLAGGAPNSARFHARDDSPAFGRGAQAVVGYQITPANSQAQKELYDILAQHTGKTYQETTTRPRLLDGR